VRTKLNRTLLALVGLALLLLGVLVLIGGLDLERHWDFGLPSWWPLDDPDQPLLSRSDRTRWRDDGWWWPTVFAGLGVLTLFLLWWLLTQLRNRRMGHVYVDAQDDDVALLRGRALESVVEAEANRLDGVDRARVTLHRRRGHPFARITLVLASHAVPATLVDRLEREQLRHMRESVGLESVPSEVRLRSDRHPASRVE
jgi:hypothetical protein